MGRSITIGYILGLISAILLFFAIMGILGEWSKNPYDSNNVANVTGDLVTTAVDQSIPDKVGIIASLGSMGGGLAVILILIVVLFWDKIMNFKLSF